MFEKYLTLRLALLVAIVFASAAPVFSRAFYGSIVGTITDQSDKKIFAARNYQIGGGIAKQGSTYYESVPANSAAGNRVNMAPIQDSIAEFRVRADLATATDQAARQDENLKVGTERATVEAAAQAAKIQTESNAATNAKNAQDINDAANVTQNPLFCAILQNGVQPRSETSTSSLGDR